MKIYPKLFCTLLLFFLLIPAGCAKSPTVTELWTDKSYEGLRYEKILVIGAAKKLTFRTLFEGELVKQLKSNGIEAIPSFVILPDNEMLTREIILSVIESSDIDRVLITSLVDKSKRTVYYSIKDSNPYIYYNGIINTMHGSSKTASYDIDILYLKTNLYDAKSEKMIWSMTSESEFQYTMKSIKAAITLIITTLKEKDFI